MAVVSMKQLLEAGVHFGHQTRRWNPKMAKYIFTERNGIYIIDLQKTVKKLEEAYFFVRDMAASGKSILFVGTKKQAQDASKEEAERFANTACAAGWQVLAIDLPEHGARKDRPEQLLPWAVVPEIQAVYARMQPVWPHIRLYGVSIGAWLAMQALRAEKPEKALLVSPVVDMETLILSMMQGAHVTEEQLKAAGEIPTEMGETLSWPYLCWVREHPLHWHGRTQVLYGDRDALTSRTLIERFRQESGAHLTIMEGGEHWFHTPVQMAVLQTWEETNF